jgi:anaerobic selenocysteine-containing dehydrogenase
VDCECGAAAGMVGKRHAGLLPIRGHSNVQGLGSIGVTPALKKAVMERLTQIWACACRSLRDMTRWRP